MTWAASKISAATLGGGLAVTGNYPGKARTPDELRADLEKAFSLIPGKHRLNLHAFYGEFGGKKVDRDEFDPEHFKNWIAWAKAQRPRAGFQSRPASRIPRPPTASRLSHRDKAIRQFWIEHCIACREIGAAMGKALGKPCVTNVWIPDGLKDTPADRAAPRERLAESLDAIFKKPIIAEAQSRRRRTASCSASAAKVTSSARTSFISATPSAARNC